MSQTPRYGMDHDRYAWRMLAERAPLRWPQGRPLALWLNVCLQHFPLNPRGAGFKPHGAMTMPYPDLRHYTLRDYGNRVGIYRILDALAEAGLPASLAINAELLVRYPALLGELKGFGGEWLGHGIDMDRLHLESVEADQERDWIAQVRSTLNAAAPAPLRGWLSPARAQSSRTPELLRAAGFDWIADPLNDELPYALRTAQGPLSALPLSLELEDRYCIGENLHSEQEWAEQCIDACEFLIDEALRSGAGRLLTLNLHAWIIGQPHRIGALERVLAHLQARSGLIWATLPSALIDHCATSIAEES